MFKKAIFLLVIFTLIVSCRRAVTRPNLDSIGNPPEESNTPIIDETPNPEPEEELIIKATDSEETIKNKIEKYYELHKKYIAIVEDSEENIKANKTMEKINSAINSVSFSQGVSLNLISTDITEIEDNTFENNANLISVEFPDTLTSIGVKAFNYCGNLAAINFPSTLENIESGAFINCANLKEIDLKGTQITILSIQVFNGCSKLEKVLLPNNLSEIKNSAFAYCYSLKEIDFPESLTTIDVFAFTGCDFVKLVFNEGLTSINAMAFYKCPSLTQISFPSTLIKIDSWAFSGCANLKDIQYNGDNPLNVQAVNIFTSYAGSKETTPQQLYLPNVDAPTTSEPPIQDPNPWIDFLGYDWTDKIIYKQSMPSN